MKFVVNGKSHVLPNLVSRATAVKGGDERMGILSVPDFAAPVHG